MHYELGFTITGTVHAATIDEACAAIAAYCDPTNHDHEYHEGPDEPIGAMRFEWEDLVAP